MPTFGVTEGLSNGGNGSGGVSTHDWPQGGG